MPELVHWPRALLKPRVSAINPSPTTVAGPASLSGFRQAVSSPAAIWAIRYDGIPVGTAAQRLAFRALAAQVEGRATPILLPVFDREELRPLETTASASATYSDGATFSDGSSYAGSRIEAKAQSAVALGATSMTATITIGTSLQGGEHFSVGTRLYRVRQITAVSGDNATFSFWPPAREAIAANATLEFDEPVCKVRLATDNGLDLALEIGSHGFPSVTFLEDPS